MEAVTAVRYVKSAIFAEVTGERIYERTQKKGRLRGLTKIFHRMLHVV